MALLAPGDLLEMARIDGMRAETPNIRPMLASATVILALSLAGAALTVLSADRPLIAPIALYPIAYVLVVWKWPKVALLLIVASAPFQKDLSLGGPVRFSIAEVHLALTLPVFLVRVMLLKRAVPAGVVFLFVCVHLALCTGTTWLHWRDSSLVSLVQMVLYLVLAPAVFSAFADCEEDLLLPFRGLVCVGSALAMAQTLLPDLISSPQLLGLNKNGIGASLACSLVVVVELYFAARTPGIRRLVVLAVGVITVALILTLSRGSWLAAMAGITVIIALRRQFDLLLRMGLVMLPLVAICWNFLPAEARDYATGFDTSRYNISARYESIETARKNFKQSPLMGVGVGLRKEFDATNIVWLTLAETGVPGLVTFLLIHIAVLGMIWRIQKRWSRQDPLYSLPALAGALVLGRLVHGMVDHYWSRGAIMIAWASVGMAIAVQGGGRARLESRAYRLLS